MNIYPTLPTEWPRDRVHDRIEVDEASSGAIRTRVMSDRPRREFPLVHPGITRAERDTLLAFYAANVGQVFEYRRTQAGVEDVFEVVFISPPQDVWIKGLKYDVAVTLREV